jgi:hypothetical protein
MMKKAIISLAVISLFVTGALAQTRALIRKDGRKLVGLVTKAPGRDGYKVKMAVGEVFVPASEVDRIEDATTPAEEFRDRISKIKSSDVKGRYKLGQWAFKKGLYSEAKEVLNSVLKIDANHERAQLLLEEIGVKLKVSEDPIKLKREFSSRKARLASKDAKGFHQLGKWAYDKKLFREARGVVETVLKLDSQNVKAARLLILINAALKKAPTSSGDKYLLSRADISRVRMAEFRQEDDVVVRVKFRNRVLQRFVREMSGRDDFRTNKDFGKKFLGYSPIRKLKYMLDPSRDIDVDTIDTLKKDISIGSDPIFMRTFRTKVWHVVRQNCATAACHGAPEGVGKYKLFNKLASDDKIAYTNFIILSGTLNKKGGRMLNRNLPEASLLLQYMLPKAIAKSEYHHPATKKPIRNLFRNNQEIAYKVIEEWIKSLGAIGYPDYGLEYKPGFGMKLNLSGESGALKPRKRTDREKY